MSSDEAGLHVTSLSAAAASEERRRGGVGVVEKVVPRVCEAEVERLRSSYTVPCCRLKTWKPPLSVMIAPPCRLEEEEEDEDESDEEDEEATTSVPLLLLPLRLRLRLINLCSPPPASMTSGPGCSKRW